MIRIIGVEALGEESCLLTVMDVHASKVRVITMHKSTFVPKRILLQNVVSNLSAKLGLMATTPI
ncbi:MAG: hypothetical protein B6D41_10080 [Chloroflexi bacterium UTCFX4]|nr:MAG: hypothetical protein B6D41_10080 [Chloroflexi bacterium UTCFX4]